MSTNDERRAQIDKVSGLEREVFAQVHHMDRNGHLVREFAHEVKALLGMLAEEKTTPAGAAVTPGPAGRVGQLLDAIRTHGGPWTTSRVFRFYRDNVRSLDAMPPGRLRTVARGDLRDLTTWGHLIASDASGRREYFLKTRKDHTP
ncbi:hypothetical protein ACFVGN_38555 [Streptomyces sp. NPDC057757]|uniref:hypothetical protein n=1 Tax=Streptomyces sp. NPDC057757 TaxID=3346241 RepID=UPI0036AD4D31